MPQSLAQTHEEPAPKAPVKALSNKDDYETHTHTTDSVCSSSSTDAETALCSTPVSSAPSYLAVAMGQRGKQALSGQSSAHLTVQNPLHGVVEVAAVASRETEVRGHPPSLASSARSSAPAPPPPIDFSEKEEDDDEVAQHCSTEEYEQSVPLASCRSIDGSNSPPAKPASICSMSTPHSAALLSTPTATPSKNTGLLGRRSLHASAEPYYPEGVPSNSGKEATETVSTPSHVTAQHYSYNGVMEGNRPQPSYANRYAPLPQQQQHGYPLRHNHVNTSGTHASYRDPKHLPFPQCMPYMDYDNSAVAAHYDSCSPVFQPPYGAGFSSYHHPAASPVSRRGMGNAYYAPREEESMTYGMSAGELATPQHGYDQWDSPTSGVPPSYFHPSRAFPSQETGDYYDGMDSYQRPIYGEDSFYTDEIYSSRYEEEEQQAAVLQAQYTPQRVQEVCTMSHLRTICAAILTKASAAERRRVRVEQHRNAGNGELPFDREDYQRSTTVALDLEGRNLSRSGSVCIITLATTYVVYIIDVVELGAEALSESSALKSVLESPLITKLMFDCRADCDALYFLYDVRLQRVCDLQVASCFALSPSSAHLPSMKTVFKDLGLFEEADTHIKESGRAFFDPNSGGSFDRWEERPLAPILLDYCAVDVKYFFMASMMLNDNLEEGYRIGEVRLDRVCAGQFERSCKGNCLCDF